MILLDTNVLSELMRPAPDPQVIRWLDAKSEMDVWISAVTVAEIRLGIALLPESKRKALLMDIAEQMFQEEFADQCLPFDCKAAHEYAGIVAKRKTNGQPISVEDAQIAAVALTAGLSLSTRNTKDFSGIKGLSIVNPWLEQVNNHP
jgi:predicted nucleic acid-binding protein